MASVPRGEALTTCAGPSMKQLDSIDGIYPCCVARRDRSVELPHFADPLPASPVVAVNELCSAPGRAASSLMRCAGSARALGHRHNGPVRFRLVFLFGVKLPFISHALRERRIYSASRCPRLHLQSCSLHSKLTSKAPSQKARLDREPAVQRAPTVALLAAGDEVVPPASGRRGSARALLEGSDAERR